MWNMGTSSNHDETTPATRWKVALGRDMFGTPKPQIEIVVRPGMHWRAIRAALHRVAAEVEVRSAVGDNRWAVQIEVSEAGGLVNLELMSGSPAEVNRAMELLRAVAAIDT